MLARRSWSLLAVVAVVLAVVATLAPGGADALSAAGKPAPVKITLKQNLTGKVTSDRAACVRRRDVYALGLSGGEAFPAGSTQTDAQGRYPTGGARRGVPPGTKAVTLVLGDAKCRVAQSPSIPFPTGRAGGKAKRKITFTADQAGASGRVTSKRKSCVKAAPVVLFVQTDPSAPFQAVTTTTTDAQGRYSFGDARLRQASVKLLTVVVGDKSCRVAQSPTRTLSGAKR